MQFIQFRGFKTTFIAVVCGVFASAIAVPACAQSGLSTSVGVPQDWSHKHLIYSNPDTREEAAAKGTLDEWTRRANDPRFVVQLEKKEKSAAAKKEVADSASADIVDKAKKKPPPQPSASTTIHRDWSNVMGGASGAGDSRIFPAKFAFGISSNDCATDFVVFTTSSSGTSGTSGTLANRTGTFSGNPTAGQTVTVGNTSHGTSIVLIASSSSNIGFSFQIVAGDNTSMATNLANAINRNGGTVGARSTSSGAVVTVTANTWGSTQNADITLAAGLTGFAWAGANLASGSGTAAQPTIVALNQLYSGCAGTDSTVVIPKTFWSYNTGAAALTETSPALSLNGDQVAFVQRASASSSASLVLLKWSSTVSVGSVGVPTTPTSVTLANYRSCTAPCMTVMTFNGSPNDTNSAPFVDYTNDIIYVGDDSGNIHKFTGVFNGTPAEQTTGGFPAAVSAGNILSSPVFDSGSGLVFVGSNGTAGSNGNRLHSVDSTGAVVNSGAIGSASTVNGVRDAPIVDSTAQRVYAFLGADNGATGSLGNTCSGVCSAVYQFSTASSLATQNSGLGAGLGAKVVVGLSGANNDLNRAISAGTFDDAYYSSATFTSPSGSLYVCGSQPATARRYTLWNITIASNSFSARTQGPQINNVDGTDVCSPVTVFKNGSTEFLFVSVTNGGSAADGGGCTTPANGCIYMYQLPLAARFDTTSVSQTINDNLAHFISVSTSMAPSTTESSVATTLTAAQAGTYRGMTILQSVKTPGGTTFTYTLRKNSGGAAITCSIAAGAKTCSDLTNTASYAAGDTIDVQVQRTLGTGALNNATFQVQLEDGATAGLNATGGTGGIIIDNTSTGGGSQIYYSTRTSPGSAVQASQAGLN